MSFELVPVLQSLPTLTYLLLKVTSAGQQTAQTDLFNAMHITDTSSDLCPNLSSLLYGYSSYVDFAEDAFFAMAQSRFHAPCRLKVLRIFYSWQSYTNSSPDISPQIQALRGGGFDAVFGDYREVKAELAKVYSS
ncbi:hypothetical protein C8R44DRAFT_876882 [Mycena epipterygia]|nr:hypothetical protein C8R44DRAFT_876882 [Mycena epipterygia]